MKRLQHRTTDAAHTHNTRHAYENERNASRATHNSIVLQLHSILFYSLYIFIYYLHLVRLFFSSIHYIIYRERKQTKKEHEGVWAVRSTRMPKYVLQHKTEKKWCLTACRFRELLYLCTNKTENQQVKHKKQTSHDKKRIL